MLTVNPSQVRSGSCKTKKPKHCSQWACAHVSKKSLLSSSHLSLRGSGGYLRTVAFSGHPSISMIRQGSRVYFDGWPHGRSQGPPREDRFSADGKFYKVSRHHSSSSLSYSFLWRPITCSCSEIMLQNCKRGRYRRPKRGPPLRSQGHCFSRPQVTRSLFFMRKLKQHRSQVVFLNCRGRAVALKMAPGRRSRKPPLGPHIARDKKGKTSCKRRSCRKPNDIWC